MHIGKIKIGNSVLVLIILYLLGYTHIFGGPYGLARFFFLSLLIFGVIFFLFMFFILKLIRQKMMPKKKEEEKINVEAKVVEDFEKSGN